MFGIIISSSSFWAKRVILYSRIRWSGVSFFNESLNHYQSFSFMDSSNRLDIFEIYRRYCGAWPVLIDEFVEYMYRINGSEDIHSFSCSDSEVQPTDDILPGLKIFTGVKRKLGGNLQDQEFTNYNTILHSKKRFTDLATNPTYDYTETVKQNSSLGSSKSPCAEDGTLSKGFAELLSTPSCLQFDRETRDSYTL